MILIFGLILSSRGMIGYILVFQQWKHQKVTSIPLLYGFSLQNVTQLIPIPIASVYYYVSINKALQTFARFNNFSCNRLQPLNLNNFMNATVCTVNINIKSLLDFYDNVSVSHQFEMVYNYIKLAIKIKSKGKQNVVHIYHGCKNIVCVMITVLNWKLKKFTTTTMLLNWSN